MELMRSADTLSEDYLQWIILMYRGGAWPITDGQNAAGPNHGHFTNTFNQLLVGPPCSKDAQQRWLRPQAVDVDFSRCMQSSWSIYLSE